MSVLGNNLLAQYYAQQEALPSEYRRVEYLESTGTQYIDLNIFPSANFEMDLNVEILEYSGRLVSFAGNSSSWQLYLTNGKLNCQNGVGHNGYLPISLYNRHKIIAKRSNISHKMVLFIDNVSTAITNGTLDTIRYTLCLFCLNYWSGKDYFSKMRLYGFSFNDISSDLKIIPCVRKSDSKPGFYDLCRSICPLTGTPFYINAGTGEFVTP